MFSSRLRDAFWFFRKLSARLSAPSNEPFDGLPPYNPTTPEPLVSVVIPTFNREALVTRAVRSVLNQTYKNLEVLVVDDGSTDGTLGALAQIEDPRLRIVSGSRNGVAQARSKGVDAAQGEYIAFLDSDDEYRQEKLAAAAHLLLQNPSLSLVHTYWTAVNDSSGKASLIKPFADGDARHELALFSPISITTVVARADAVRATSPFKNMKVCEDLDFLLRLSMAGPIALIREPLTIVHLHGENAVRDIAEIGQNELSILDDIFSVARPKGLRPKRYYARSCERRLALSYLRKKQFGMAYLCMTKRRIPA